MRVWWKEFNIMKAVSNIGEAWSEVSQPCMKGAWKKIFKKIDENHIDYENGMNNIIEEIRILAISGGIEGVDKGDIHTLLESHREPLN